LLVAMSCLPGQMAPSLDASAEVEIKPVLAPKPIFLYLFLESMEVKDQPMRMRGVADSYLYMDTPRSLAIEQESFVWPSSEQLTNLHVFWEAYTMHGLIHTC